MPGGWCLMIRALLRLLPCPHLANLFNMDLVRVGLDSKAHTITSAALPLVTAHGMSLAGGTLLVIAMEDATTHSHSGSILLRTGWNPPPSVLAADEPCTHTKELQPCPHTPRVRT
jgi:hypothetical protein